MDLGFLERLLLWCAIANYGALVLSALVIIGARDWVYRMHSRWFQLTRPQFDVILYILLGLYKLATWFFLIVPWAVLALIR
jgi:hypothetical protein